MLNDRDFYLTPFAKSLSKNLSEIKLCPVKSMFVKFRKSDIRLAVITLARWGLIFNNYKTFSVLISLI